MKILFKGDEAQPIAPGETPRLPPTARTRWLPVEQRVPSGFKVVGHRAARAREKGGCESTTAEFRSQRVRPEPGASLERAEGQGERAGSTAGPSSDRQGEGGRLDERLQRPERLGVGLERRLEPPKQPPSPGRHQRTSGEPLPGGGTRASRTAGGVSSKSDAIYQ